MAANLNSCIFFDFAPIFRFAMPFSVAMMPRTTLLIGSVLPSRFLIIWIRAQVRFVRLVVITFFKVIAFSFFLVGLAIISLDEKIGCKIPCVSSCWLPSPLFALFFFCVPQTLPKFLVFLMLYFPSSPFKIQIPIFYYYHHMEQRVSSC